MSTIARVAERTHHHRAWLAQSLIVAGLLAVLYAPVLKQMVVQWWEDPNYGHGFIVPLFAGYVLYERRHALRNVPL